MVGGEKARQGGLGGHAEGVMDVLAPSWSMRLLFVALPRNGHRSSVIFSLPSGKVR